MNDKRGKVSVLLDRDEYERFDAYCKKRGFKKSTLIARLVREHLDREGYRMERELPFGSARDSPLCQYRVRHQG